MNKEYRYISTTLILGILLIGGLLFAPIKADAQGTNEKIKIVCTNSILADFTKNIAPKKNTSIEYIMPAGVCPAHFDTSPGDVDKIVNADIIISLGWEPWLESLINKSYNKNYYEIKCIGLGEWNIPTGAIKYVKKIEEGLKQVIPQYNQTIQKNTENYLERINETTKNLKQKIKTKGLKDKKVVCIGWYKDFLNYFGLNVSYYYGAPESLSVQDELNVIDAASKDQVTAVVDNLQSGTEFGARVASETGKSHVILTNFPNAIPGTESYLKTIQYNVNQTIKGIETYDYKKTGIQKLESQINDIELQRNASVTIAVILAIFSLTMVVMYRRK
ncbi:MAG: metal ABC transporter substrate-binding protein [Candidatus Thermoplasmatota archaeon]